MNNPKCLDFKNQELRKGDWVIRCDITGSKCELVYSRIQEEPCYKDPTTRSRWSFWISTYHHNRWGGWGRCENPQNIIKISEEEVPLHIREEYGKNE